MSRRLFAVSGIFHPEPGGPATYLYELLPELLRRGWDVRALTYGDAPVAGYPYPLTRIPRRALPLRLAAYARAAAPLLRWADLVYVHTLGLPLVSGRAARVVKIVGDQAWERAVRRGWIAPDEDIDRFQTGRYGPAVEAGKAARSREVRAMQGVIVPSEYLRRVVAGWGVPPEQIRVIYNALSPGSRPVDVSQAEARARWGLGGEPVFLTAARLVPWKGVDHLLLALRAIPGARLLVAGEGQARPQLEALAAAHGLSGRVRFLGHVDRDAMPLLMRAADYTVLYSGYEGLSHTLLESLQAGTPVIASDKGGNPEVVRHGINGLLVPYADTDALADALRAALAPGKRDALAANSQIGMERFEFSRMVAATDAALAGFLR